MWGGEGRAYSEYKEEGGVKEEWGLGFHLVSHLTYCAVGSLSKDLTLGPQDGFFMLETIFRKYLFIEKFLFVIYSEPITMSLEE